MLDLNLIRNDFENTKKKLEDKKYDTKNLNVLKDLDIISRELSTNIQQLNAQKNIKSSEISIFIKNNQIDELNICKSEVTKIKKQIDNLQNELNIYSEKMMNILSYIPNLSDDSVPVGKDESDNLEIKKFSTPTKFNFEPLSHWDIAKNKKLFLANESAKITGSRFALYYNQGAKLYRALQQFTLDQNSNAGFIEVFPQSIINEQSLFGTSQFPKFKEDVFKIENSNYYLSPTAEVQLTNIYRDSIIDQELPVCLTANTTCFRSEAGSAGRDTRGVIRLHQFSKTELVVFSNPKTSFDELERITRQAESILELLELPYRRILLCTGDSGFSSAKTYDIEVWLPSYNDYKEISSCSNCLDFQSRRAMIRFKEDDNSKYVHTLNGSSLAIDRLWVAVVENYQDKEGNIKIPKVLQSYMNNIKCI